MTRDIAGLCHQRLEHVVKSDRFISLSVESDGSHRFELRPNEGLRYVIEARSLAKATRLAHEYIVAQEFEEL